MQLKLYIYFFKTWTFTSSPSFIFHLFQIHVPVLSLVKKKLSSGPSLKEYLSNKDRIFWQLVLWMPLILPFTKGHRSNEDSIILQKGCSY